MGLLAVTTTTRSEVGDLPSVGDFVPGYEATGKSTPTEVVNKLNVEVNAALADSSFKERLVRR
jgi:hypothetical protein